MTVPALIALALLPFCACLNLNSLYARSFGIPGLNQTFDYVIIGGRTAGLTLASRLSENGTASVAVVEAGVFRETQNGNYSTIPPFSRIGVTEMPEEALPLSDWGIDTVPQPQLNNRILHYTQGKCFGGGSAWNNMIYHRGSVGSYDRWAVLVGDQSYSWANMQRWFKRSIHFNPPNNTLRAANATPAYNISNFSPLGGPVQVSFPHYALPISSYFPKVYSAVGLRPLNGSTSGDLLGWTYMTMTQDPVDNLRSGADKSFLTADLGQTWPLIFADTLAKQVLFDSNKTATGVKVQSGKAEYVLHAKREVVVSAGVMRSPQLLMVSGIGPAATLQGLNISVVKDLPGVGQNMWDSGPIGTVERNVTPPVFHPVNFTSNTDYANSVTAQFLANRTGPLTNMGQDIFAWEKLPRNNQSNLSTSALEDLARFPSDWPEVEYAPNSFSSKTFTPTADPNPNVAGIFMLLTAATSRGNVTINSTDTNDNPVVSTNWLLSETDMEVAVAAYRRARQMWDVLLSTGIAFGEEVSPGANYTTDAELRTWIRGHSVAIHHGCGTCKMGMSNDSMAVVDSRSRVLGVSKLRVVDASSFPFTPPGHTQASVYAHAEKIAVDIMHS